MNPIATTTRIPLAAHLRTEAGNELQATLAELLDLQLVGKQMHWTVAGPLFRPLHEQLDEFVDAWRDLGDTVAERCRERMDRLGEIDLASQDVLTDVVRALEQQLWMIRAQFAEVKEH